MSKKMTIAEKFGMVRELVKDNKMLVEFIDNEIAKVEKKNASRKPTKAQEQNADIKSAILEGMEVGKTYTITEIIKAVPACAELTNQRVSALVRQLKDEGKVVRSEVKGKAYFTLA